MINEGLLDKRAVAQCLGAIINEPSILDDYPLEKEDFALPFYQLIFSAVYNLYYSGVNVIDCFGIDSYLSNYKEKYQEFNDNEGLNYVSDVINLYQKENFHYYLTRLKKFSLLRYWESQGYDVKKVYDYTVTIPQSQETEAAKLDHMTIEDMIDTISSKMVDEPRMRFSSNTSHEGQLAGKGLKNLKESFKEIPDYGLPLQSPIMSTITRGCRGKKLFLRSSNSGGGKTRTGIADLAGISVPYLYNIKTQKWDYTGFSEPGLIISTELEIPQVQTILAAYVSGVNEAHILDGKYKPGEEKRVDQAIEYIEASPLYIEFIPDFGIADIEQLIRKYRREKSVYYVFFDYIHMSNKLIMEVAQMSSGMRLREDQILFLFIDALKNACNKLDCFILTSTQLNGTYKDSVEKDETMLRGAKSMADRVDMGEISLAPTASELKILEKITRTMINCPSVNLIRHVYKLRGNKWSKIKICQHADLGTGRTTDLFVLDRNNLLVDIPIVDLQSVNKEQSTQVENIIKANSADLNQMPDDLDIEIKDHTVPEPTKTDEPLMPSVKFDW